MTGLSIVPIKLGFGAGGEPFDGLPYVAKGEDADRIFEMLRDRSAGFGTVLTHHLPSYPNTTPSYLRTASSG